MQEKILKRRFFAIIFAITIVSVAFIAIQTTAQPAVPTCTDSIEIYLELDGISGDKEFAGITGLIKIKMFSSGGYKPSTVSGSSRIRADVIPLPITLVKDVGKNSPKLNEKMFKREVIPLAKIRFYNTCPDEEPNLFYQIDLKNIQIISIHTYYTGAEGSYLQEEFSFNYEEIKWTWKSSQGMVEAIYKVEIGE